MPPPFCTFLHTFTSLAHLLHYYLYYKSKPIIMKNIFFDNQVTSLTWLSAKLQEMTKSHAFIKVLGEGYMIHYAFNRYFLTVEQMENPNMLLSITCFETYLEFKFIEPKYETVE